MTAKRRVIWMDDENWDKLGRVVEREQARTTAMGLSQKITRSLVILDCLDRGHFQAHAETAATTVDAVIESVVGTPNPLRKLAAVERFNSQPFRGPIPKKR
jgi:hypothetical protein